MGSDRCSKYVKLCTIEVCAPITFISFIGHNPDLGNLVYTECMAMVLHRDT